MCWRHQCNRPSGATLKATSLLPHIEEYIAQEVIGDGLVADEPKEPTIDIGAMAGKQHLHGKLVAGRNALNLKVSSEEYPTAVAAIAGAAATADAGRIDI